MIHAATVRVCRSCDVEWTGAAACWLCGGEGGYPESTNWSGWAMKGTPTRAADDERFVL